MKAADATKGAAVLTEADPRPSDIHTLIQSARQITDPAEYGDSQLPASVRLSRGFLRGSYYLPMISHS